MKLTLFSPLSQLRPWAIFSALLAACLSVGAQTWFSLQEGDVRSGSDPNTVNTNGTVISSSYTTHATYISSANPTVNYNGNTNLVQGSIGTDFNRVLLGFDLTPIANYVAGQAYTISGGNLAMTWRIGAANSGSTFGAYTTTPFDETTATWNNPGGGAPAGGTIGTTIQTMSVVAATYPAVTNWSGANLNLAISTALANPTNQTVYLMLKRVTESSGTYTARYVTDENADPTYGGVDSRPELKLAVTILSNAPLVSVAATDPSAAEQGNAGESSTDTATFTITRTINLTNTLTVYFSFAGSATFGADYISSATNLITLPPNVASTNIVITPLGDTLPEDDETVTLNISNGGTSYGVSVASATATIHDDNDGQALVQYMFGNSFAPQVWNTNLTATVATFPGLSATFSGFNLSPPASFQALNSLTGSNEVQSITKSNFVSAVITPNFGYTATYTNLEISTCYYYTTSTNVQQAVLFVRSSLDNFAADLGAITNPALSYLQWQTLSIALGSGFSNTLGPIEFRLYMYDDTDDATKDAALRADNFFIRGKVAPLTGSLQEITIAATTPNAAEPSTPGAFTITRAGDLSAALDVHYIVGGTASNGVDYSTLTGVATIPAGTNSVVVPVNVIDDLLAEGPETVILILQTNANLLAFGPISATVTIADNAEPTQLTVAAPDNNAYEGLASLTGQFTITRAGDVSGSTTANFSLAGTAVLGVDYTSSFANSVTFAPGETNKTLTITPINNALLDGTRTVVLTLATNAGYLLLAGNSATVSIYDDELPPGAVLFSDAFESAASATNYVVLAGARDGGVADSAVDYSFDYSTIGLPPAPGSSTTKGLKVTVNKTGTNQAAVINLFPANLVVSNNYALRFNLFAQWNPNSNFVEHALAGINHSGTLTNWSYSTGVVTPIMGDGQFIALANTDTDPIASFFTTANPGITPVRSSLNRAVLTANFNNPPYGATGGLPGVIGCSAESTAKTWVDCELSQVQGIVRFKVNGATLFTYTNTSPFTSGRVMLGYMDSFDSLGPTESFAVFDNVRVVQLPPVPQITGQPQSRTNITGTTAAFTVAATGEPLQYQWFFGAAPLAGATAATLSLPNVQLTNAGSYKVVVTNSTGSSTSQVAVLTVNRPPTTQNITFERAPDVTLKIKISDLLALCSDPDGDPISFQGVDSGTNSATVTTDGDRIFYAPANNNNDALTWTVSDNRGGSATAVILINVLPTAGGLAQSVTATAGGVTVDFAGIPGFPYLLERADDSSFTIGVIVLLATNAPPHGQFSFTDPDPPQPMGFYRLRYNPQ